MHTIIHEPNRNNVLIGCRVNVEDKIAASVPTAASSIQVLNSDVMDHQENKYHQILNLELIKFIIDLKMIKKVRTYILKLPNTRGKRDIIKFNRYN